MYRVLGTDGKIYGPAPAEQIRAWLAQGRLESHSPVLPAGAPQWTSLGLLPEFARDCGGVPPVISPLRQTGKQTNGFAIAGFICGLISLPAFCCFCGCPFNLLGLIFSIVAMVQISRQQEKDGGWGLALAGLICSVVSLFFGCGLWLLQLAKPPVDMNWHGSF